MTDTRRRQHRLGLALVAAAAIAWSTAGFFTRLIALDAWTLLFWRGIFGGLFIAVYVLWVHRAETWRAVCDMGWPGWFVTACSTLGMTTFLAALTLTSVADVAVIYAASPFVTAGMAWLWLGEALDRRTMLASTLAFLGVALTIAGATGGASSLLGDLLALIMTLALAAMTVAIRRHRAVPMLPAACLSNFLGALVSLPFAAPLAVTSTELGHLALFGLIQMSLGLTLYTIGSRLVPAAEATLISLLESALGPVWVWLAFRETPSANAMAGGLVVLAAILGHVFCRRRAEARG